MTQHIDMLNPDVPATNHMMVDIETLGIEYNSPIVQIGAVVFTESGIITGREWDIEFPKSLEHASMSTILWWLGRPKENIDAVFGSKNRIRLGTALHQLGKFYKEFDCQTVWSKGPDFDLNMIEGKFKIFPEMEVPWKYNAKRDYRTILKMFQGIPPTISVKDIKHSAHSDAFDQTTHLLKIVDIVGLTL